MEILFLGVGEACDGSQPNTAILLKTSPGEKTGRILLDCGFSVPHHYLSLKPDPEELAVLWISHFHGDHFLGAPLMLLWFWEMARQLPLHLIGPPGVEQKITQALELAYPTLLDRLGFPLVFTEMEPGEQKNISDGIWRAAYNEHSQPCLSLRLEISGKTIFYSGDGRPTPMTESLAPGCDLIIHEAYGLEDTTPGHGSIAACLEFALRAGASRLALVHLQRNVRPQAIETVRQHQAKEPSLEILLPKGGSTLYL